MWRGGPVLSVTTAEPFADRGLGVLVLVRVGVGEGGTAVFFVVDGFWGGGGVGARTWGS